jgi:hypothetical protein
MGGRGRPTAWLLGLVTLAGWTSAAAGEVLISDDFQHRPAAAWTPAPAAGQAWQVVAEPGQPENRVLTVTAQSGRGQTIAFGQADWTNYRLSARFRLAQEAGGQTHIKFGCRSQEPSASYCLNVRTTGPAIVHHVGREFLQLGGSGPERIEPGRWYAV